MDFTPTNKNGNQIQVPYLEDARADFAPYYAIHDVRKKSISAAQNDVSAEIVKLGGSSIWFQEGYFGRKPSERHGYVLHFEYGGIPARMIVAGLPIKAGATDLKIKRVRLQALYILRDWLKSAVTAQVFSPGNHPLMQFLLVDGRRTLAEMIIEENKVPNMNPLLPTGGGR